MPRASKPKCAHRVYDPIYDVTLEIWTGGNQIQAGEAFGCDTEDLIEKGQGLAVYHISHPKIWCKTIDIATPYHLATLVHELLHVTIAVMRGKGLSLTEESEEAYTWHLDYLVRKVAESITGLKAARPEEDCE